MGTDIGTKERSRRHAPWVQGLVLLLSGARNPPQQCWAMCCKKETGSVAIACWALCYHPSSCGTNGASLGCGSGMASLVDEKAVSSPTTHRTGPGTLLWHDDAKRLPDKQQHIAQAFAHSFGTIKSQKAACGTLPRALGASF